MPRSNAELERIKKKIVPILKKNKVSKAGIFGSVARGEHGKRSDVDILVEIPDDRSLLEVIRLKLLLEKAIKRKIDLVEYGLVREEIRENILNDEIKII